MGDIQIFNNSEFGDIRTAEIDGKPYFMGSDVAKALGYAKPSDAVTTHCRATVKYSTPISGKMQDVNFIPEGDLYRLIVRSKLPSAERFESWVFDEVLPEIRKTGSYSLPQTYSEALRALADQAEQTEKLRIENNEMKPKAEFFDAVAGSRQAISLGEVAKILNYPKVGRNKLFEILRDQNVLQRDNLPYQKYIDNGYFRVIEQKYNTGDEVRISFKTLVYQKGVDYIRKTLDEVLTA